MCQETVYILILFCKPFKWEKLHNVLFMRTYISAKTKAKTRTENKKYEPKIQYTFPSGGETDSTGEQNMSRHRI